MSPNTAVAYALTTPPMHPHRSVWMPVLPPPRDGCGGRAIRRVGKAGELYTEADSREMVAGAGKV